MIILKTMQKQDLLVDLRNRLIYVKDRDGQWEPVAVKQWSPDLEIGRPLTITDHLGILEGLVPTDIDIHFGPHPAGRVRCSCGALRDADGECQRCDYERCDVCKTALRQGRCPKDPAHNPQPVLAAPAWKEPLPIEEYQKWEDTSKKGKKGKVKSK